MVDRIAEEGAIQYAQQSTADVGTVSRLAGAGQIEADMIRLVVDGFYTEKVSGLSVRGRIINKMIDAGFLPKKRYNFTDESKTLDSSITFSRTSNATVTDSDGLIKYAAHNLLANSEAFDSATYSKVNATVTANVAVAPNGTTTADKFIADATANQHRLRVTGVATTDSNICSIYAKAAEYDWIILQGGGSGYAYFDVNNGVVGTQVNTVGTIESVGDGWFRCSVALTGSTTILDIWVTTANGTTSFTGDGTSGVYIWGAQLINKPCVSNDYVSTTPANLLGFTEEFDNAAWTKSNSFVQTNLLAYSEQFDNAVWTKTELTVSANATTAPNGTTTADRIIESTTASATHVIFQSAGSAAAHSLSFYLKPNGRSWVNIRIDGTSNYFNITTGVLGTIASGNTATIVSAGDGWYRCSVARTMSGSGAVGLRLSSADNTDIYTGDGNSGIFIWGAQLVQGSTAGEYTQTGASTAAITYTDPFGVKYARKLVENTSTNFHFINSATITVINGSTYTASIYIKEAGRGSTIEMYLVDSGIISASRTIFDLSTGTITSGSQGSITAIGNGWYRCSIYGTVSSTSLYFRTLLSSSSYTGDGTSGIYISGAQLSNSASIDPYVYNPTTAITSAARYMPRFNYSSTGEAQGLLIEEQRTNSIRNNTMVGAVAGTPGTVPTNWAISSSANGVTREIVEFGSESGVIYIEVRFSGTPTAGNNVAVAFEAANSIAATSGQTWTGSTYIALVGGSLTGTTLTFSLLETDGSGGVVDNSKVITPTAGSLSSKRDSLTATLSGGGAVTNIQPRIRIGYTVGTPIDITLRIGLPQLEQGAFATSVIPTSTTAVTRNADNASILGRNFASWYNQSEGTVYTEFQASPNVFPAYITASNGTIAQNSIFFDHDSGNIRNVVFSNSSAVAVLGLSSIGTVGAFNKLVASYKLNDFAAVRNGGSVVTDTSGTVPTSVTQLDIGKNPSGISSTYIAGTIKSINYWPTRLTNSQLVAITS